jgi:NADP-dependent 3-hydroxy acid dehydrogenase YdfG
VLGARREDALARVVADIEAGGGHATARGVDVTRPEDLALLFGLAVERFGRLDALVANAGVASVSPLAEGTLADWNQMLDVNLRGVLHGIAAALPVFNAQGSGPFVTKAGVRALCEVLRQEVGLQIRATMVCPGATDTEFTTDPQLREWVAKIAMAPDAVAEAIAYALAQPDGVNIGEIVVRSAAPPLSPDPTRERDCLQPVCPRNLPMHLREFRSPTESRTIGDARACCGRYRPGAPDRRRARPVPRSRRPSRWNPTACATGSGTAAPRRRRPVSNRRWIGRWEEVAAGHSLGRGEVGPGA